MGRNCAARRLRKLAHQVFVRSSGSLFPPTTQQHELHRAVACQEDCRARLLLGSPIDLSKHLLGIAVPQDLDLRGRCVDVAQVLVGELERGCAEILA